MLVEWTVNVLGFFIDLISGFVTVSSFHLLPPSTLAEL